MAMFRFKMLGAALLGLLVLVTVFALLGRPRKTPPPSADSRPAAPSEVTPLAAPAAAPAPAPAPRVSRSKGQTEWAFFFRPGDTLSRMSDGGALGAVVRLERSHAFPDGSAGPAYVVQSTDRREAVFDADELERSARIEAIREIGRLPTGARPTR
jgi:hypothetical protein